MDAAAITEILREMNDASAAEGRYPTLMLGIIPESQGAEIIVMLNREVIWRDSDVDEDADESALRESILDAVQDYFLEIASLLTAIEPKNEPSAN